MPTTFSYGPDKLQVADIYQPPIEVPGPTVLVMHGGNWSGGSRGGKAGDTAKKMAKNGLRAVSIDYTLVPKATGRLILNDPLLAMRETETLLGPLHTGWRSFGYSAGCHMSAMLGALGHVSRAGGVSGPMNLVTHQNAAVQALCPDGDYASMSPALLPLEGCPMILFYGFSDPNLPYTHGEEMYQHLLADDFEARLIGYKGGHTFDGQTDKEINGHIATAREFLRQ